MLEVCYISSANRKYKKRDLVRLLRQARVNNEKNDITGLLLYDGIGTFLQTFEGDEESVEALFAKIKLDKRHKRVNLLGKRDIKQRSFGDWQMGFKLLNEADGKKIRGFSSFLRESSDESSSKCQEMDGFGLKMLEYFRDVALTEIEDSPTT